MLKFLPFIATCCALILFQSAPHEALSEQRVYLDIASPEARKIIFSVPPFSPGDAGERDAALGKNLAETLAKALRFHGVISIIPVPEQSDAQRTDWKKTGADYAVLGAYSLSSASLRLEFRLLDVAADAVVMRTSSNGITAQRDKMIFRLCDDLMEKLTGVRGVASSRIAFVARSGAGKKEAYISDILGRNIRQVTRHNNLVVSPRFTPDGMRLSYTSYHAGNQNLYITDLRQNITTRALSRRPGMNLAPAWTPNGRKMVLTLSLHGNPDLYLLDERGRILQRLTSNGGLNVSPTFSPDGKQFAFVSDRSGNPQIYSMNLRSKRVQRLTFEGDENAEPSWSPTENRIAYSSLVEGVYQLFTIEPKWGAQPFQITHDPHHHESPVWSPDGNQILFTKRDGAGRKIYAIMENGDYQRRLFSLPGDQSYPRWSGR